MLALTCNGRRATVKRVGRGATARWPGCLSLALQAPGCAGSLSGRSTTRGALGRLLAPLACIRPDLALRRTRISRVGALGLVLLQRTRGRLPGEQVAEPAECGGEGRSPEHEQCRQHPWDATLPHHHGRAVPAGKFGELLRDAAPSEMFERFLSHLKLIAHIGSRLTCPSLPVASQPSSARTGSLRASSTRVTRARCAGGLPRRRGWASRRTYSGCSAAGRGPWSCSRARGSASSCRRRTRVCSWTG